ncbi:MAG: SufE family protein [Gammaproteobacteria bacterium]|jgi:cysteine desulfuration protein SufE
MNPTSTQLTPAAEILETQKEIVETFSIFDDWTDRYQYIIDLGKELADLDDTEKIEENRLKGCQSQVWIVPETKDGRLHFAATSDSAIVCGLIALMLKVYSGRLPTDIIATPPEFIREIELESHLSPTRSNGLSAMVQQIRQFAVEALAAERAR